MVLPTDSVNQGVHQGFYGDRHAFPSTECKGICLSFCPPYVCSPVVRPGPERRRDIDLRLPSFNTPCHFLSPELAFSPRTDGSLPTMWSSLVGPLTSDPGPDIGNAMAHRSSPTTLGST